MADAIGNLTEVALRYFSEFGFRRFMVIVVMLLLLALSALAYDHITGNISLNREKECLELLKEINGLNIGTNSDLYPVREKLVQDLYDSASTQLITLPKQESSSQGFQFPDPSKLTKLAWVRFFLGGAFWFAFAVYGMHGFYKAEKGSGTVALFFLILGILCGVIDLALPNSLILDYLILPIGVPALIVGLVLFVVGRENNKTKLTREAAASPASVARK